MSLCSPSGVRHAGDSQSLDASSATLRDTTLQLAEPSWFDGWCRAAVHAQWQAMAQGRLVVREGSQEFEFGQRTTENDTLTTEITIHDHGAYRATALGGSVGAAESYLRGEWTSNDLVALVRLFCRNGPAFASPGGWLTTLTNLWRRWGHWWRGNTPAGSRRNIADHYDLGNDLFGLFLDETMSYSSGIFPRPDATLREASLAKFDRVCQKLELLPGDHLLEIGCGWGGLALHAATHYGCRVTATTISREQYEFAERRIADAGLSDRITLLLDDYRDLRGTFDKLASVEMVEAVGHEHLPDFFRLCGERLRPGGAMLLQAIVMPDRHYDLYLRNVDFIQQYVFPGGHLPSLGAIATALGSGVDLDIAEIASFPQDYARTLAAWRSRFHANLGPLRGLGLTDSSLRMWDYYFAYCEGAFREGQINVVQALLTKPGWSSSSEYKTVSAKPKCSILTRHATAARV